MSQTPSKTTILSFNSPLEAAIRALIILNEVYPEHLGLQKLITFDHIIVHSDDMGGPKSLHPQLPLRNAEILVRRQLVEDGVLLLLSRNLIERIINEHGIFYIAGEEASPFLCLLQAQYIVELRERAIWIAESLLPLSDNALKIKLEKCFGKWTQEFQSIQTSSGAV